MEQIIIVYDNIECYKCGIVFGINRNFNKRLKENTNLFYCPNGHPQVYVKSTADRLAEDLERKERTIRDRDGYIANLEKQLAKASRKPRKNR
jgi:hypothetical protein